jgi:hypothetical protein
MDFNKGEIKVYKKIILCLVSACIGITGDCHARGDVQAEAEEQKKPEDDKWFLLTGTVGFLSDYLSRAKTQTFGKPAVQGGLQLISIKIQACM